MRHIIFRAWDKTIDEMFCHENISGIKELYFTQDMSVDSIKLFEYLPNGSFAFKDLSISDVELMQYTGLLDKNGVKIFEGDVVRFIDSEGRDSIIEVRFENGGFYPFAPDYLHCSHVEVIGNKFENPELLGENK